MSNVVINDTTNSGLMGDASTINIPLQALFIAGAIAGILTAFYIIYGRIRIKINHESLNSFFDADRGDYVQERSYRVTWGKSFRPIRLPHKFNSGSELKMWFKPTTGPMDKLTKEHYAEETKFDKTKINLSDKKFYQKQEIERLKVITETRLDHDQFSKLVDNIVVEEKTDRLIVINQNEEEVRNFPVSMPNNTPVSKGFKYMNTITEVKTYKIIPNDDNQTEQTLVLFVNLTKQSEGGRLELPLEH